jgi:hypothetical protein
VLRITLFATWCVTLQGKLSEAEALFMNVWESFRSMYGGDQHPDVLTVVHNLGGKFLCVVDCYSMMTVALETA